MNADQQTKTILVVDDEPAIRTLAKALLERAGYKVLAANGPAAGMSLYRKHRAAISMVLTDVKMPGMSGLELAGYLRMMEPRLPVLLMSGTTFPANGDFGFVQKPFTHSELICKTAETLGSRRPAGVQLAERLRA